MNASNDKNKVSRADNNEKTRREAQSELAKLLALACGPDFDGTVEVSVSSKLGRLGRVKISYNQHL
jgi:hypothetical protein